jgi:hypothetical protein
VNIDVVAAVLTRDAIVWSVAGAWLWQVACSGRIFGDRWVAGETVELCGEHDERAARLTGAEDYVDA